MERLVLPVQLGHSKDGGGALLADRGQARRRSGLHRLHFAEVAAALQTAWRGAARPLPSHLGRHAPAPNLNLILACLAPAVSGLVPRRRLAAAAVAGPRSGPRQ